MKAIEVSLNLFETQTDLEKGPQVAFLKVIAELRDPGEINIPTVYRYNILSSKLVLR